MAFGTDASNRMGSPQAIGGQFYNKTIDQSLRFEDGGNAHLTRTSTSTSTSDKQFTFSCWFKRGNLSDAYRVLLGTAAGGDREYIGFLNTDEFIYQINDGTNLISNQKFRDTSAWYHIVVSVNINESVDSNRQKIYINGEQITSFSSANYYGSGDTVNFMKSGVETRVGNLNSTNNFPWDGYMADVHFVDGQTLGPEYFGQNKNGIWIPKQVSGVTYGTNGFHIDFSDSSDLGKNVATGNTFASLTSSGITASDQVPDSPTNNFVTLNPVNVVGGLTFSEGNLKIAGAGTDYDRTFATSAVTSGKWYAEFRYVSGDDRGMFGVIREDSFTFTSSHYIGSQSNQYGIDFRARAYSNSSELFDAANFSTGDIGSIAFDADDGKLWFGKNGQWFDSSGGFTGDPGASNNAVYSFTSEGYTWLIGCNDYSGTNIHANFGQDATFAGNVTGANGYSVSAGGEFKYQPPAGYKALKVNNLPEPTFTPRNESIENSYFYTVLYEGNGGGQRVGQFLPLNEVKTVNNAIRFEDGDTAYLTRTPAAAGNLRNWTFSAWVKRSNVGIATTLFSAQTDVNNWMYIGFLSGDTLTWQQAVSASVTVTLTTSQLFKDTSKWYHIVCVLDSDQATAANRQKIYIDGELVTSFGTSTYIGQNIDSWLNKNVAHQVGRYISAANYMDGYMADVHFVDGQSLTPTSFGQTDPSTETWIPKTFTGNHGQNGFHLEFLNDTVGADSANTNSWTPVNLTTANTVIDTPTKSFSTLDANRNGVGTLSDGNLTIATTTNSRSVYSNFTIPTSGKWYWEIDVENYTSGGGVYIGLAPTDSLDSTTFGYGDGEIVFGTYNGTGYLENTTSVAATWCNTPGNDLMVADGEVLQIAYNADDGEMFVGKDGTWFRAGGARDTFANATKFAQSSFNVKPFNIILTRGGSYNETYRFNFGQETADFSGQSMTFYSDAGGYFAYAPPSGYKALNTDNFPQRSQGIARRKTPVITWIKNRDSTDSHMLFDQLRGPGNVKHPDLNAVKTDEPNTLQKFLPGGFQIGNDVQVNTAGESYVAWNWCMHDDVVEEANSAITGTGFTDARRLVDRKVGLSVMTYVAAAASGTIDHGLGQTPDMILATDIDRDTNWFIWHKDLANAAAGTHLLNLDTAGAEYNPGINHINDTAPTSSAFAFGGYLGAHADTSGGSQTKMLYSFKSIPGFSKFGRYTGNNSTDGPYVHCGFKPGFLFLKNTANGATNYLIYDNKRDSYNQMQFPLFPSVNNAEYTSNLLHVDFLSNGFKIRNATYGETNQAGYRYIFWAMAEAPGKYSNAR